MSITKHQLRCLTLSTSYHFNHIIVSAVTRKDYKRCIIESNRFLNDISASVCGECITALWDIASCSLVEVNQRFGGAYCLHHQGDDDIIPEFAWRGRGKPRISEIRIDGLKAEI
jgi:hypothetical protein